MYIANVPVFQADYVIVMMMLTIILFSFLGLCTYGLQQIAQAADYDAFDNASIHKLRREYNEQLATRLHYLQDGTGGADKKPGL